MSSLLIVQPIMPVNNISQMLSCLGLYCPIKPICLMAHLFRITSGDRCQGQESMQKKTGYLCSPVFSHNITSSHTTAFCFLLSTCIRFISEFMSQHETSILGKKNRTIQDLTVTNRIRNLERFHILCFGI